MNDPVWQGFAYRVSDEDIERFMELSHADRLRWLHAINQFLRTFTPQNNRASWMDMLSGDPEPPHR